MVFTFYRTNIQTFQKPAIDDQVEGEILERNYVKGGNKQ